MWWTLAAASVGSLTAILIAFVAYPWQRRRDRMLQIQTEKREAYSEFLSDFSKLEPLIWGWDSPQEAFRLTLKSSFSKLYLYAPTQVIDACEIAVMLNQDLIYWNDTNEDAVFSRHGQDYSVEIDKAFRAEKTMIASMRNDLWGDGLTASDIRLGTIPSKSQVL